MEHPAITKVNRIGHLNEKPEHWGIDVADSEILVGDDIVKSPYGEIVLEENLRDYLIDMGFVFSKAE